MINHYEFNNFKVNVFQEKKEGTDCCGDSFYVNETDEFLICGIADGLGSGRFAKEASRIAVEMLQYYQVAPLQTIMEKVNESQQYLRGVVMSILKVDLINNKAYVCGMGNINLIINDNDHLYAMPISPKGYISGGKTVKVPVLEMELPKDGWFALYSDGIHIQPNQIPYLYRVLDSKNEDCIKKSITAHSIRNRNDDATLIIGRFE
ncbi:MAG: protein phosphatase 2C domain-containing protein [Tuberibacillus sp.]